jgi:hypothetical protein
MKTVFADMVTFTREVVFESVVTFRDRVFFEARVAFSDPDMAGRANIGVGMQRVHIDFEKSYDTPPIVTISPVDHYEVGTVKNLSTEGFDIEIAATTSLELKFNWIALLVTNASDRSSEVSSTVSPTHEVMDVTSENPDSTGTESASLDTATSTDTDSTLVDT